MNPLAIITSLQFGEWNRVSELVDAYHGILCVERDRITLFCHGWEAAIDLNDADQWRLQFRHWYGEWAAFAFEDCKDVVRRIEESLIGIERLRGVVCEM